MMMVKTPKSGEQIEDLVDFYQQWPDLRDVAMNMSRDGRLDQKERVILQWMVRVVDRVGPVDLKYSMANWGVSDMGNTTKTAKWQAVELFGWTRRAYGRTVMWESDGGTLRGGVDVPGGTPGRLYLRRNVRGRMLVQLYCNGREVLEDLVSHGEFDRFVDLKIRQETTHADLELHLIPATNGSVRIEQNFQLMQLSTPLDRVMAPVAN